MAVYQSLQLAVQCLHTHPQHPAAAKLHSALTAALGAAHPRFALPPPAPSSPLQPVAAWCVDTSLATLPQVASASVSSLARPLQLFAQRQLLGWIALCAEDDASTDLTRFLCERDGRVVALLSALVRSPSLRSHPHRSRSSARSGAPPNCIWLCTCSPVHALPRRLTRQSVHRWTPALGRRRRRRRRRRTTRARSGCCCWRWTALKRRPPPPLPFTTTASCMWYTARCSLLSSPRVSASSKASEYHGVSVYERYGKGLKPEPHSSDNSVRPIMKEGLGGAAS